MYVGGCDAVWVNGTGQMHKYGKHTPMISDPQQQFMEKGTDAD
jgi:hypothetical protein